MSEPVSLTYCGNVHPASDLDEWLAQSRYAVAVARDAATKGRRFGMGAWWNAAIAAQLATDVQALDRVRRFTEDNDLPLWTLNVFPHGGFHDPSVKTAVYTPDWASEERLLYTRHAATAAARLCVSPGAGRGQGGGAGAIFPLSTLPLGYRPPGEDADLRLMARNLARAASALAAIEEETGVCPVLALEPEPCCLLETAAGAAAFLEEWLFEPGAWTVPEDVLRRHLGVCIDLCHLFVVGEDPIAAYADLRGRGIAVPKIQVSSCLEVREPATALSELWAFDEARYLHQTFGQSGAWALDLDDARRRAGEFARESWVRSHFHMPLHWDQVGPFGSTRDAVARCLPELIRGAQERGDAAPLLEVETYTWSVLAGKFHADSLVENLVRELDFAAGCLPGEL